MLLVAAGLPLGPESFVLPGSNLIPSGTLSPATEHRLDLSAKEFGILEALMRGEYSVLSAEDLLAHVWGEVVDPFTNIVQVTMSRLRRKLGEPSAIQTITNVGYRIDRTPRVSREASVRACRDQFFGDIRSGWNRTGRYFRQEKGWQWKAEDRFPGSFRPRVLRKVWLAEPKSRVRALSISTLLVLILGR